MVVLIVPHHWLAADGIVAGLRRLAASPPDVGLQPGAPSRLQEAGWSRLILLAPDHNMRAGASAVTAACDWLTPYGTLPADSVAIGRLLRAGAAAREDRTVALEHGASGLLPAVRRLLPDARLVPVVVRNDGHWREVLRLAAAIGRLWTEDTVLVVSTDFSHDVLPLEARRQDARMIGLLRALDPQAVRRVASAGCDAWNAMAVAQLVAKAKGATQLALVGRTDGSQYAGYGGGPVTSYVVAAYTRPSAGGGPLSPGTTARVPCPGQRRGASRPVVDWPRDLTLAAAASR